MLSSILTIITESFKQDSSCLLLSFSLLHAFPGLSFLLCWMVLLGTITFFCVGASNLFFFQLDTLGSVHLQRLFHLLNWFFEWVGDLRFYRILSFLSRLRRQCGLFRCEGIKFESKSRLGRTGPIFQEL